MLRAASSLDQAGTTGQSALSPAAVGILFRPGSRHRLTNGDEAVAEVRGAP
jgi:hypothetical protein